MSIGDILGGMFIAVGVMGLLRMTLHAIARRNMRKHMRSQP